VFEIAKELSSEAKVCSCCASARGHVRSTAELYTSAGKRSGACEAFIMTLTFLLKHRTVNLSRADPRDQEKDCQESSASLLANHARFGY